MLFEHRLKSDLTNIFFILWKYKCNWKKNIYRFITIDLHILNNESSDYTNEEFETSSTTGFDTEEEDNEFDNSYSDALASDEESDLL